jgi:hypothetical protein
MGWVHPSELGGQNAAVGIEDTGSPLTQDALYSWADVYEKTGGSRTQTFR